MKHFLVYILILIITLGCTTERKTEGNASDKQELAEHKPVIEENKPFMANEDFEMFLARFSTDSAFQVERVKFPLRLIQYDGYGKRDTLNVEPSDYILRRFNIEGTENQRYDAYTQENVIEPESATVQIRGVDNGIRVDYNFELVNSKWRLVLWLNESF